MIINAALKSPFYLKPQLSWLKYPSLSSNQIKDLIEDKPALVTSVESAYV
jgi:hypothetical protein